MVLGGGTRVCEWRVVCGLCSKLGEAIGGRNIDFSSAKSVWEFRGVVISLFSTLM